MIIKTIIEYLVRYFSTTSHSNTDTKILVITLIAATILALIPAAEAHRKNHQFLDFYVFGLISFPLATLTAYLMPNKSDAKTGDDKKT